ncbi:MAG: asparagine synthase (glutamine-hydrolyzing) [Bryobacterales bacterium]|nr:asparagine synthase (glutamine-hydrolyzing) [Bryobacterales bacterium]
MCGIAGILGRGWNARELSAMVATQWHRGPDMEGIYCDPMGMAGLGHSRLSIIDRSEDGRNPMANADGSLQIVFNGEIYNYLELKRELSEYPFRTHTDTEVILAAYEKWGEACLDRFIGMFAFLIWDSRRQHLFAARDRFGVKPLHYHHRADGCLLLASEIRALHAAGAPAAPNARAWSSYLVYGLHDHSQETFHRDIFAVPAGHCLMWQNGKTQIRRWYDLAARVGQSFDARPLETVEEEYLSLLMSAVKLRFRADVPVGINLSGGLDSSLLLGLVQQIQGPESDVKAFTYITGDPRYDELPWVRKMTAHTKHPVVVCELRASDVPALAESVQAHEDEPFGGIPTLAYARIFERARSEGVIVLLEGQGQDEQWAGYDYYELLTGASMESAPLQGTKQRAMRPECLVDEFRALAEPLSAPKPFADPIRNRQYLDSCFNKIPRALRFNDRISMRSSTELRQPFLDHRLFELAMRQPADRKIRDGIRKWTLRRIARGLAPGDVVEAPKRPLQTPQREWLAGPLRSWVEDCIDCALAEHQGEWIVRDRVRDCWREYLAGSSDNSFFIWQWVSLGMSAQRRLSAAA